MANDNGVTEELILARASLPPLPFEQRVDAAVAGGFDAIGLSVWEYERLLGIGYSDADLQKLLKSADIKLAEFEVVLGFSAPPELRGQEPVPGLRYTDRESEHRLFCVAELFEARHVLAVGTQGSEFPEDDAVEKFAELCKRAEEHGLLVALEFIPSTNIPDLPTASRIVQAADRPNGGLCVDSWHHFRGRNDFALLADVPAERVCLVQIDDGPKRPVSPQYSIDTFHYRQAPGTGDFDLTSFLQILWRAGVSAPVCVEVMSDTLAAVDPVEVGILLGETARTVLSRARQS